MASTKDMSGASVKEQSQNNSTNANSSSNEQENQNTIHQAAQNPHHAVPSSAGNPSLYGALASQLGHSNNTIIIHVCDESKKRNQDFKCDRNILIANMKYFEKYLSDSKNLDDIDISVHCDINIFDWLMRYIHKKEPKLDIKNDISILISSDFLQMAALVEESVKFVSENIHDIIGLPIDMNCLNSHLVKKLA